MRECYRVCLEIHRGVVDPYARLDPPERGYAGHLELPFLMNFIKREEHLVSDVTAGFVCANISYC